MYVAFPGDGKDRVPELRKKLNLIRVVKVHGNSGEESCGCARNNLPWASERIMKHLEDK